LADRLYVLRSSVRAYPNFPTIPLITFMLRVIAFTFNLDSRKGSASPLLCPHESG